MINVNVKNKIDWAISSQAAKGLVDGSTIRLWSPERTVKAHERGGVMMKKENVGVYAIKHKSGAYYGSSTNIVARFSQHRTDLRLGRHGNKHLQEAFHAGGFSGLVFTVVELCDRDMLVELENKHMQSDATAFNIIPANRAHNDESKIKISKSLKRTYANNPTLLQGARDALVVARASDAMKENKHSPEANKLRASAQKEVWDTMTEKQRTERAKSISNGMTKSIPMVCGQCGEDFIATSVRQKWCGGDCRMANFVERQKAAS